MADVRSGGGALVTGRRSLARVYGPRLSGPHDAQTLVRLLAAFDGLRLSTSDVQAELGWSSARVRAAAIMAGEQIEATGERGAGGFLYRLRPEGGEQ